METAPKTWALFWSPTGQHVDTVKAHTARQAKRKVCKPYRNFIGELFAVEVVEVHDCTKGEK